MTSDEHVANFNNLALSFGNFERLDTINFDGKPYLYKCFDGEHKGKTSYIASNNRKIPTITVNTLANGGYSLFSYPRDYNGVLNSVHHDDNVDTQAWLIEQHRNQAQRAQQHQKSKVHKRVDKAAILKKAENLKKEINFFPNLNLNGQSVYFDEKKISDFADGLGIRYGQDKHGKFSSILLNSGNLDNFGTPCGIQKFYDEFLKDDEGNPTKNRKKFVYGSKTSNAYFLLGKIDKHTDNAYVCEGLADAIVVHKSTNTPVICVLSAGNIKGVASNFVEKFPDLNLVFIADNDNQKYDRADNVGVIWSTETAQKTSGKIIFCDQHKDISDYYLSLLTNFDEATALDEIAKLLKKAKKPISKRFDWYCEKVKLTGLVYDEKKKRDPLTRLRKSVRSAVFEGMKSAPYINPIVIKETVFDTIDGIKTRVTDAQMAILKKDAERIQEIATKKQFELLKKELGLSDEDLKAYGVVRFNEKFIPPHILKQIREYEGIAVVLSIHGTGKTSGVAKSIVEMCKENDLKGNYIVHRISLNRDTAAKLGISNYQQIADSISNADGEMFLSICVNSITGKKFAFFCNSTDVTIIDEVSQVYRHLASGPVDKPDQVFNALQSILGSNKVVAMDANIDKFTLNLLQKASYANYKPLQKIYVDFEEAIEVTLDKVRGRKSVVVCKDENIAGKMTKALKKAKRAYFSVSENLNKVKSVKEALANCESIFKGNDVLLFSSKNPDSLGLDKIELKKPLPIKLFINEYKAGEGQELTLFKDKELWFDNVLNDVRNGEKVAIATDNATLADSYYRRISKEKPEGGDVSIVKVTGDNTGDANIVRLMSDVNKEIKNYYVVIYSPAISSGVSIEVDHFTKCYGYFDGIVTPADAWQMLRRVRNAKHYNIYLNPKRTSLPTDVESEAAAYLRTVEFTESKLIMDEFGDTIGIQASRILNQFDKMAIVRNCLDNAQRNDFANNFLRIGIADGVKINYEDESLASKEHKNAAKENKELTAIEISRNVCIDKDVARVIEKQNTQSEDETQQLIHYNIYNEFVLDEVTPDNVLYWGGKSKSLKGFKAIKLLELGLTPRIECLYSDVADSINDKTTIKRQYTTLRRGFVVALLKEVGINILKEASRTKSINPNDYDNEDDYQVALAESGGDLESENQIATSIISTETDKAETSGFRNSFFEVTDKVFSSQSLRESGFVDMILKYQAQFDTCKLGLKVPKNLKEQPAQFVTNFLKQLGIYCENAEQVRIAGKPIRYYKVKLYEDKGGLTQFALSTVARRTIAGKNAVISRVKHYESQDEFRMPTSKNKNEICEVDDAQQLINLLDENSGKPVFYGNGLLGWSIEKTKQVVKLVSDLINVGVIIHYELNFELLLNG